MRKIFAFLVLSLFALSTFAGMPYLDNTTRKIQVILAAAKTTSDLQWTACYQDQSSTYTLPLANTGTTNGLTSVDVIPAPAASTSRHIISLNLYNADTVPTTATIRLYDTGPSYFTQWYGTLNVGDQLAYSEARGFEVTDNSGNLKTITGSATFSGLAFPGRLTPHGSAAVPTADAVGVTAIDYLPAPNAVGYYVPVYNGSSFQGYSITSSGITLTLNTSNHLSGKLYDVFAIVSSNTLILASGPAWTSTTARSQAITQTTGNIWTNSTSMTAYNGATSYSVAQYQGTYLGTFYASANGQTSIRFGQTAVLNGSNPLCYIWNAYNQVAAAFADYDSTASYSYTTAAWRQSNGSSNRQFNFIIGLFRNAVTASFSQRVLNSTASVVAYFGLGINSIAGPLYAAAWACSTNPQNAELAVTVPPPQIGYSYIAEVEYSSATGTTTWSGNGSYINYIFWY